MGRITKEQLAIIDSLTCERLTISEANKTVIQNFENNRNKGLVDSLREEAWEEDANGSVAYYLIKDKEGYALFFFSLKCGALFEQLNEEQLKQNATYWKALERILKNSDNGDQNRHSDFGKATFRQEFDQGRPERNYQNPIKEEKTGIGAPFGRKDI